MKIIYFNMFSMLDVRDILKIRDSRITLRLIAIEFGICGSVQINYFNDQQMKSS